MTAPRTTAPTPPPAAPAGPPKTWNVGGPARLMAHSAAPTAAPLPLNAELMATPVLPLPTFSEHAAHDAEAQEAANDASDNQEINREPPTPETGEAIERADDHAADAADSAALANAAAAGLPTPHSAEVYAQQARQSAEAAAFAARDAKATAPTPPPPTPRPRSTPRPAGGAVAFATIRKATGHAIELYGPGGIGKTSLALLAPGPIAVADLDDSLPVLAESGDLEGRDVRIIPATDWAGLRAALAAPGWDEIKTIVIDSLTAAESACLTWVLANVKTEKGKSADRIEDYGYGKGYRHLYDEFCCLFADLDAHKRAGRNVILVCHDCTATVPNPAGEDYLRFEPRLYHAEKQSIRARVKEWCDHVLFLGYDIEVAKDGVAKGRGSRTIYPQEQPWCLAKSRSLADTIVFTKGDVSLWRKLLG